MNDAYGDHMEIIVSKRDYNDDMADLSNLKAGF